MTAAVRRSSTAVGHRDRRPGHRGSAGKGLRPVSNPQRFAPLTLAADALVANLAERFEVTVTRAPATPRPVSKVQPIETIRITPLQADQAPLTITTTSFPGLYLDVGAWQHLALPGCGREEQVHDRGSGQLLHGGGRGPAFRTYRCSPWSAEHTWDGDGWSSRGTRTLARRRVSTLRAGAVQPPPDGHWRPWPLRGQADDRCDGTVVHRAR